MQVLDSNIFMQTNKVFEHIILQVWFGWQHDKSQLDRTQRKASEICLRSPLDIYSPHILQIMPGDPKYDQCLSKGHHNEENPCESMTKMAIPSMHCMTNSWKPQIWPVSLSQNNVKIRKITWPLL